MFELSNFERDVESVEPVFDPDETRSLVCEGACNPELSQYDAVRDKFDPTMRRDNRQLITDLHFWVKDLKHTPHKALSPNLFWKDPIGWCRAWRCTVCNHKRYL